MRRWRTGCRVGAVRRRLRVLLQEGLAPAEGYISAAPRADLVGKTGTAFTDLRPSGVAVIADERIDVVTEGDYVPQGSTVTVVRSDGYRHVVRSGATPDA